ncbi:flagella synthesis protein FlgN [Pseudoduganella flava]|uniref:Flagella synthesis protein FlgN n=2 Tax=Pseudoduganella flava TaxID=871742 RepID=A0A562PTM0_9BURK|nr:flagellar protein FlgN [Pseudoduganella flava]QGZ39264.1 flagellar protein FlgN [Pseudoduganella flava]TWI47436.1 flagella synthesis protein FlgN [Pseudoduganella flava]
MHNGAPILLLREEQRLITVLLDVLKEEQQYLVAADIDQLAQVTPRKAELINQMAVLATERHKALGSAGFEAREAGMEVWLAAHGTDDDKALWNTVLEQTREAKEVNRLNGMLINKQLSHTQGALQALRPPSQAGAVYGPSGRTTTTTTSRGFLAG